MSGGSYDYLWYKDAEELFSWDGIEALDKIATSMINHGAVDIAKDTLRLKNYIEQTLCRVEVMQEALEGVFHAVERRDSCDIGDKQLKEAFERYRNGGVTNGKD